MSVFIFGVGILATELIFTLELVFVLDFVLDIVLDLVLDLIVELVFCLDVADDDEELEDDEDCDKEGKTRDLTDANDGRESLLLGVLVLLASTLIDARKDLESIT